LPAYTNNAAWSGSSYHNILPRYAGYTNYNWSNPPSSSIFRCPQAQANGGGGYGINLSHINWNNPWDPPPERYKIQQIKGTWHKGIFADARILTFWDGQQDFSRNTDFRHNRRGGDPLP